MRIRIFPCTLCICQTTKGRDVVIKEGSVCMQKGKWHLWDAHLVDDEDKDDGKDNFSADRKQKYPLVLTEYGLGRTADAAC